MIELTRSGKFKVTIEFRGAWYYLGCFDTAEEATAVYDKAAASRQSQFARFNFPDCSKVLLEFSTGPSII